MTRTRPGNVFVDPTMGLQIGNDINPHPHGPVVEEIEGLIKVHKDGFIERPQIVPFVPSNSLPHGIISIASRDVAIERSYNIWARLYVPTCQVRHKNYNKLNNIIKLPLVVYFHGGGFCVGSAAWSCYHEFLAKLAVKSNVCIVSVNYRLAPENPLPAAYEDGFRALKWLKQQALLKSSNCCSGNGEWWRRQCDFSRVFLAGDSAGANIAYNLSVRLVSDNALEAMSLRPLSFKGMILIQPFFGGEGRTESETTMAVRPRSALSLAVSDTYWRLALPAGADRDHPWCNPDIMANHKKGSSSMPLFPTLVCVSEKDILRDRNLEFCRASVAAGNAVEHVVYEGVGHAFQVLSKSPVSLARTEEMMLDITSFIDR